MAGIGVKVELGGIADAKATLARLAELGGDLTPVYDEIGAAMVASQQNRFERGVEPDGTPWMPSWRAVHKGGKTLIDSGLLLNRLTHNADGSGAEWGFNDRRAATLHYGATIRPTSAKALAFMGVEGHMVFAGEVIIPGRPMVGVDADDISEIAAIIGDAIERAAGEAAP